MHFLPVDLGDAESTRGRCTKLNKFISYFFLLTLCYYCDHKKKNIEITLERGRTL